LQSALRYEFTDASLLTVALTHRSAGKPNNERLEFLGDAIIGFLVAEFLHRETLAGMARELNLGSVIALGEGEQKSGGWRRDSILANALEAVLAAIYLDGGMEPARLSLRDWYGDRLLNVDPGATQKDSKTRLQEFLQQRRLPLPTYSTREVEGPPHAQSFTVVCTLETPPLSLEGRGNSRRHAEQEAARLALTALHEGNTQ
jgi:ribonuclease-3